MEALAALAPAIAEVNILMDMRLIEVDQVMALIARAVQQGTDPGDESLPLLRLGATEQLVGLLPRQLELVQRAADGLAAEAAAELRLHEANQTPQRPAWLYLGSGDWRTGRLALRGAKLLAKRGGNIRAKGGAATGALIGQRLGAVFIVGMQPAHYDLCSSSRAVGNRRGTTAFGDLVQRQEAFAAARMRGAQGQMAQIRHRLVPTLMINS